jgi:uncharacterized RDD family membrane protein YckC
VQYDTVRVRTAENVGLGYEVAGIATRLLAFLIDLMLSGMVVFFAALAWLALTAAGSFTGGAAQTVGLIIFALVALLAFFGYFTIAEATSAGRTPGKRALGLRVIRIDGSAPTLSDALVRNLLRIVDVFVLGIGLFVMFANSRSRRLGDIAAGTVVVRERTSAAALPQVVAPVIRRTPDAGPEVDGLDRLGAGELVVVRTFLTRSGMEPRLRTGLAADISRRLQDRMQLAADAPERQWPAELFLERLYLQLSARLQGE